MKSYTKSQLAYAAGVSVATFRRWLKNDEAYLRANHISANSKLLPPHVHFAYDGEVISVG